MVALGILQGDATQIWEGERTAIFARTMSFDHVNVQHELNEGLKGWRMEIGCDAVIVARLSDVG
jgi:hypothetical protein